MNKEEQIAQLEARRDLTSDWINNTVSEWIGDVTLAKSDTSTEGEEGHQHGLMKIESLQLQALRTELMAYRQTVENRLCLLKQ